MPCDRACPARALTSRPLRLPRASALPAARVGGRFRSARRPADRRASSPDYFSDAADRRALLRRRALPRAPRETPRLSAVIEAEELLRGPTLRTTTRWPTLRAARRHHLPPGRHLPHGQRPLALGGGPVLRVRGVDGLRVADASVMPDGVGQHQRAGDDDRRERRGAGAGGPGRQRGGPPIGGSNSLKSGNHAWRNTVVKTRAARTRLD